MHELSVTEQILAIAVQHAAQAGASRILRVDLVIGEMTGFVNDSIQLCFEALSDGTIAAGAELGFTRIPVRVRCRECGTEFEPEEMDWLCPGCGAFGGEVIAGRELYVDSIEME